MVTRLQALQAQLGKVRQEIEDEKESQRIHDSLVKITEKVGAALAAGAKDANLNVDLLDGNVFRCSVESGSGKIRLEQVARTVHGSASVAMITIDASN